MNNRLLILMTVLVLVGIGILFALNVKSLMNGSAGPQTYLRHNDVRGIAVKYHNLLYTLNFKQQNDLIDLLNRADPTEQIPDGPRQKPDIEQIIIYQFDNKPDLILTPAAYIHQNLIYSAPAWNPKGYFMDTSEGQLKDLLSETYDH